MKGLISILIPIYEPNYQHFEALLESIDRQSLSNYEVIISDDAPDTGIEKIIASRNNPRIKYIRNDNSKGIFHNLNNAVRHASGQFLQIFCQDDFMASALLEKQVRLLEKHPSAGMVFAQSRAIDVDGQLLEVFEDWYAYKQYWKELIPRGKAMNYFFAYGCIPGNLSPCMLRREVIDNVGLFNPDYPYVGDLEYWIRVAEKYDLCYNRETLVHLRRHEQQASHILGWDRKLHDQPRLWEKLFRSQRVNKPRWYLIGYINQAIGIQMLHGILKKMLRFHTNTFSYLKVIHRKPFNLFFILLLYLITFRNTWKIFRIDESDL